MNQFCVIIIIAASLQSCNLQLSSDQVVAREITEISVIDTLASVETQVTNNQQYIRFADYLPDNSKIIYCTYPSLNNGDVIPRIYSINPDGTGQKLLVEYFGLVGLTERYDYFSGTDYYLFNNIVFTQDSKKIIFATTPSSNANYLPKGIYSINVDGTSLKLLHSDPNKLVLFMSVSSTSPPILAFVEADSKTKVYSICTIDLSSGKLNNVKSYDNTMVMDPIIFADGSHIVYALEAGYPPNPIHLMTISLTDTTQIERQYFASGSDYVSPKISQYNELFFLALNPTIYKYHLKKLNLLTAAVVTSPFDFSLNQLTISQDGSLLAIYSSTDIEICDGNGTNLRQLKIKNKNDNEALFVSFSLDKTKLLVLRRLLIE